MILIFFIRYTFYNVYGAINNNDIKYNKMIKRRSIKVVEKKPKSKLSGNMKMDKAKRGGRNANAGGLPVVYKKSKLKY